MLAAVVAAALATLFMDDVYEAQATIQAGALADRGAVSAEGDQALARSYAEVLTSGSFLERIHSDLPGEPSVRELQEDISAEAVPETAVVRLKARASSPEAARDLAEQIAESFIESLRIDSSERVERRQREIDVVVAELTEGIEQPPPGTPPSRLEQMRASRAALVREGAELVADGAAEAVSARLVGPPSASPDPVSPRPRVNLVAGVVFGLLLGAAIAWWRERQARPLRSAEDAAALTDVPVLGTIPLRRRLIADDPVVAEAYDILRANLMFQSRERGLNVLTVVSENPRVGKSSTVEGLARAAQRAGARVAVIDGDLRLGELSSRLGAGRSASLGDVLSGSAGLAKAVKKLPQGFWLLPARPPTPDPPSLLNSPRMDKVVTALRGRFDLVLIDSPPVSHLADGLLLAGLSDGVLMVVRPGTTSRPDLVRGIDKLRQTGTTITGLVVFTPLDVDATYYPTRPVPPPPPREEAAPAR